MLESLHLKRAPSLRGAPRCPVDTTLSRGHRRPTIENAMALDAQQLVARHLAARRDKSRAAIIPKYRSPTRTGKRAGKQQEGWQTDGWQTDGWQCLTLRSGALRATRPVRVPSYPPTAAQSLPVVRTLPLLAFGNGECAGYPTDKSNCWVCGAIPAAPRSSSPHPRRPASSGGLDSCFCLGGAAPPEYAHRCGLWRCASAHARWDWHLGLASRPNTRRSPGTGKGSAPANTRRKVLRSIWASSSAS